MHPDIEELRPKLKEILYDCAVELRATKAALYLLEPIARRFELVTEYGFRGGTRHAADFNDPVVDRCGRGRSPFYVNGLTAEPRFSEMLFEASTDRMLVAPLFSRGQLIGLVDMRDKAAKALFDNADLAKAQGISDRIVALFAAKNVFGQRFITLADVDQPLAVSPVGSPMVDPVPTPPPPRAAPAPPPRPAPAPAAPPAPRPPQPQPVAMPQQAGVSTPVQAGMPLSEIIQSAGAAAKRIVLPLKPESVGENELPAIRDVLKAILLLPGVMAAAFSATGSTGGVQEIAARGTPTDEALHTLEAKLHAWLTKRGESPGALRTNIQTPLGLLVPPIAAAKLQKVFTATVNAGTMQGIYLTVAFSEPPERNTHELLALLLNQMQVTIEHSMNRTALHATRAHAAARLIEPEFTRYPDLRHHSEAVAAHAEALGRFLGLPQNDVETVKVCGLVHDVGMRVLDYDRLYRKRNLTEEEFQLLREHVKVGAAMVEPLLGHEIARAVLCHHERIDGGGYPHELQNFEIPLAARMLQICDAYVAMADPGTYQPAEAPKDAFDAILCGAGSQFDSDLAHRFVEMMTKRG